MIRTSEQIDQLAKALYAFQAAVEPIPQLSNNPHLRNKYASLTDIMAMIQPLLTEYGLVITQGTVGGDGLVGVTTRVIEVESGQWQEAMILIPIGEPGPGRNLAQEVGSTLTYLRRYSVGAALNLVVDEDTDGAINPRAGKKRTKKPAGPPPPPPPGDGDGNGHKPAANPMTDYWNQLGAIERGCYRSWDTVRAEVQKLERYGSSQAVSGVIRKLYPGFTENGYPTEATADHGKIRVAVYRTVKAYAGLRDDGMDGDRAKVMAFETAKNLSHV